MNPDGEGPRTGLRLGWVALAVMVAALVASGVLLLGRQNWTGTPTSPDGGRSPTKPDSARPPTSIAGGGATFAEPAPDRPGRPAPETTASISVSGIDKTETIACGDRPASISGIDNTIALTGHCARVDVSGIRNVVSVEEADAIVVSGMDNNVTYRSGNPDLSESGLRNTLTRV